MNWISYPENKPNHSQSYVISVLKRNNNKEHFFKYVAYYDVETDNWYKYDGFVENDIKELIQERVVGWVNDLPTYLG
ncbi:hypothetical protein GCM10007424_03300 [Flavobacterium suaedae]|uniref:DUF551 domain-containing protein n=1 Tax=Flavobacterium suaedae TaxID=1767027 RepID=A0ABQ1JER2_9FLAO|nr:hypothetical protein [Flavobacterium suaedae]GGB66675.1 hypothetical protein GCM10007424_03300 [Flavobacterium suaedae]